MCVLGGISVCVFESDRSVCVCFCEGQMCVLLIYVCVVLKCLDQCTHTFM